MVRAGVARPDGGQWNTGQCLAGVHEDRRADWPASPAGIIHQQPGTRWCDGTATRNIAKN